MSFILNPFQADIDLTKKDNKKLFEKGCQGLQKDDKFDGKRASYPTFMKLIKVAIESVKIMDALTIGTTYNGTLNAKLGPLIKVNILDTNTVTDEQMKDHCNLVWSNSSKVDTANYFDNFVTIPADTVALLGLRNQRKIRHVMLGKKIVGKFYL